MEGYYWTKSNSTEANGFGNYISINFESSFRDYLRSIYYIPGTIVGADDTVVSFHGAYIK